MAPILTRVGQAFGFGASSGGASGPTGVSATGGTKTTVGDYTLHTFTSPGNFVTSADTNGNIQFLMVGGGGSGGNSYSGISFGGGGGGSGYYDSSNVSSASLKSYGESGWGGDKHSSVAVRHSCTDNERGGHGYIILWY